MTDRFANTPNLANPMRKAVPVVPHDTAELPDGACRAVWIGNGANGGVIVMRGVDDTADITWKGLGQGVLLPFRAQYIRATGTTATDILALY